MNEQCSFGVDYEQRLIASLLRDKHFFHLWLGLFDENYLVSEMYRVITKLLKLYKEKYNDCPDRLALDVLITEYIAENSHSEEVAARELQLYKAELARFYDYSYGELEFVKDNALKYLQIRSLEEAVLACGKLVRTADAHKMVGIVQKALAVGTNVGNFGMDFFESRRERALKRYATPREENKVPFFIPKFDDTIGGVGYRTNGSGSPELLMFGGGANVGKSRCLGHMAKVGIALGLNGIIFSAEQSEDLYAERLDMSIAMLDTPGLYDPSNFDYLEERLRMVANQGAKLYIKKFPSRSVTIPQTVAIANMIKSTLGIELHFIVWDYTGEFKPEGKYDDRNLAVSEIVSAQKRACDELGCAGFGAFQLNREGMKAEMADLIHAAEDISVVRVADIVITLGQTQEEYEKELPEMRWCARKVRSQERNQLVRLIDNRKKMCFTQHPDEAVL